jgi:HK97 family phage prohead protease
MDKQFFTGRVKEINTEQRTLTAYASTGDIDRDNEVIRPEAWRDSISRMPNVPLLWAHEYRVPPVGKALNFSIDVTGLKFTAQFANTEFANEIWGLYRDGFLDSFSVGFQPKAWEDGQRNSSPDRVYTEAELFEVSAVPVPANPHARVMRDAVPMITWKSIANLPIEKEDVPPVDQKRGRVLSAANERKLRDAADNITAVLAQIESDDVQEESLEAPATKEQSDPAAADRIDPEHEAPAAVTEPEQPESAEQIVLSTDLTSNDLDEAVLESLSDFIKTLTGA